MTFMDYRRYFDEGGLSVLSQDNCEELRKLCEIVLNNHYAYVAYCDREDLVAEGMLKCIELLRKGTFDPNRASLKNFLYTGIRNEMGNYLYRHKKEIPIEEFFGVSASPEEMSITVDYRRIEEFVKPFNRGVDYTPWVIDRLEDLGFDVQRKPQRIQRQDPTHNLTGKLVCMVLWKIREFCL